MKTVLFFLYLNSLGIVLAQTRQPFLTDVGCTMTKTGHEYAGPLSVTRSGRTCQRWDSDQPHTNKFKDPKLYPDGSLAAAGNKCRNPDKDNGGVWCFTNDSNTRWEYCNLDFCDVGCKMTTTGHEYAGPLSVTRSGRICQRWDSDQPHRNKYKDPKLYPDGSLAAAGNKCRNPDKDYRGVWCFTNDPNTRYEYCNVDLCVIGCKNTMAGHEYNGHLNVTRSGRTCQRWNSNEPHENHFMESDLFPEGSAVAAGNKCRNPDEDYEEGVWCYTTDPNTRWEECDVDFCECKLTKAGREYAGSLSVTRSGRRCQRWSSDQPHSHSYEDSDLFPEGDATAAGNRCRNPDEDYNEGVWCYTTDPNTRWEECDVDFCQTESLLGLISTQTRQRVTDLFPADFTSTVFQTNSQKSTTLRRITSSQTQTFTRTTAPVSTIKSHLFDAQTRDFTSRTTPASITDAHLPNAQTRDFTSRTTPASIMDAHLPNGENASTNIVMIVVPIVGLITVICSVIGSILVWKCTRLFQSSVRNPSSEERNQQMTVAGDGTTKPNDDIDDDGQYQQLYEVVGGTEDYVETTDYTAV